MAYIIHLIFILTLNTNLHEFHVSKTDVNYNTDNKSLELTVHVFIDDFELGLKEFSPENLKLFDALENTKSDSLISLYFSKYLSLSTDNNALNPQYIGKEISDDLLGAWCYLEVEDLSTLKNLKIRNALLLDVFDDQKNIINIKVNNKSKAFHILDKSDYSKDINI